MTEHPLDAGDGAEGDDHPEDEPARKSHPPSTCHGRGQRWRLARDQGREQWV